MASDQISAESGGALGRDPARGAGPPDRIVALDGLRGVAALLVVLYHYTQRYVELYGPRPERWLSVEWGYYGVRLFFIISGFVIFMTLDRSRSTRRFAVARFARLYPVFWASLALTQALVMLAGLPGRELPLGVALRNLTMTPALLGVSAVDGVYWSLYVELQFYVVVGLAYALGGRVGCFVAVGGLVLASAFGRADFTLTTGNWDHTQGVTLWSVSTYWFSMFLVGMTIYDMRGRARWWHGVILALCAGEMVWQQVVLKHADVPHAGWTYVGVISLFGVVVWAASRWRLPLISSRPLVYLGTISYAWYLTHQNIGYIVIRGLEARGVGFNWAVLGAIACGIALASALTWGVEKPAGRLIRRWTGGGARRASGNKN